MENPDPFFLITPGVKSKYMNQHLLRWKKCGSLNVNHGHLFWKCPGIGDYWKNVHKEIEKILGYNV